MYERNWLGGIRGSPRYTREKVRLSTRREREEAAEMTNRLGEEEGGRWTRNVISTSPRRCWMQRNYLFPSPKFPLFSPAQANIDTNIEYLGRALQHLYIMKSRDPRMIFFSNR